MGFLNRLMGVSAKKENLMRRLLKERIKSDSSASSHGQGPEYADSVSTMMLIGLPEATIVTCVETWANFNRQGRSEQEAAAAIAQHRRVSSASGGVVEVIQRIMKSEHGHSGFMTPEHVDYCIRESRREFGV